MLWDCENCGCMAIAGDLAYCPVCFKDRASEEAAETPVDSEPKGSVTVSSSPVKQPEE